MTKSKTARDESQKAMSVESIWLSMDWWLLAFIRSSFKTVEGQCTGKRVGSVRGTGRRDVHNAQPVAGS